MRQIIPIDLKKSPKHVIFGFFVLEQYQFSVA